MVTKSGPSATGIKSTAAQNKPPGGGKPGAGQARGGAKLPTTAKTTPMKK